MPHGGNLLIDAIAREGITRVFCVPGESYLAALDALHDTTDIETIICRQEGAAAMAAEATAKLTGRAGVCFVTRGPGATNASCGVHVAFQDSSPLVLFVGLPPVGFSDREAFQEFDIRGFFGAIAKHVRVVTAPERIAETVSAAFHIAQSGRPGPVVIGLPEDVLSAEVEAVHDNTPASQRQQDNTPAAPAEAAPSPSAMAALAQRLSSAERPLMIVGGPGWSSAAGRTAADFAAAHGIALATAFRCQDYIDNRHPNHVGHLGISISHGLARVLRDADLVICVGARLGEMTTGGYARLEVPTPSVPLVHVHPDPSEIGRVYRPDVAIAATSGAFLEAIAARSSLQAKADAPGLSVDEMRPPAGKLDARSAWVGEGHAAYLESLQPERTPGRVRLEDVVCTVRERLAGGGIVTNGAGNYAAFVHRYMIYPEYRSQLAPTSGSMGYGLPAAIAAALEQPDKPVVCFAGDGCLMMAAGDLATVTQYGLNVTIIVANNAMFGTIRMHQERHYPARVSGTSLTNPDFVGLAVAHGGRGWLVADQAQFATVFEEALAHRGLALIELPLDPEAITPTATLTDIRGV